MPPQQPERLLDFIEKALRFRAHDIFLAAAGIPIPFRGI
jgi:hypothetical protein